MSKKVLPSLLILEEFLKDCTIFFLKFDRIHKGGHLDLNFSLEEVFKLLTNSFPSYI